MAIRRRDAYEKLQKTQTSSYIYVIRRSTLSTFSIKCAIVSMRGLVPVESVSRLLEARTKHNMPIMWVLQFVMLMSIKQAPSERELSKIGASLASFTMG